MIEADFNNVTRDRHIKARVPGNVLVGARVVVVDVEEKETLEGEVLAIVDGRATIDVGGGRVLPRPLGILYHAHLTRSPNGAEIVVRLAPNLINNRTATGSSNTQARPYATPVAV